eukprot:2714313-Rhodomonas_salina.1
MEWSETSRGQLNNLQQIDLSVAFRSWWASDCWERLGSGPIPLFPSERHVTASLPQAVGDRWCF